MATRITDYAMSITEPSRLELLNIARWLADKKKTAYLVGGWAVYYYAKSREDVLGSKDIDLVFQNKREKEEFEQQYCRSNGYFRRGLDNPKEWVKQVHGIDIVFDPDVLSKTWKVRGTSVGWNQLANNCVQLELEAGTKVLAPAKELLLLYKCVALVERTGERKKPSAPVIRLDSKIWKDANDILALHETEINDGVLADMAEKTGLAPILNYAKQIIATNYENYGLTQYTLAKSFLET